MSDFDAGPEHPRTSQAPTSSRRARYQASPEAEARVLLLIDAFSRRPRGTPRWLEGRVKLAKLDFLLRYPQHLARVLAAHGASDAEVAAIDSDDAPLEARMMRYRYGPWDPAYYAVLGSLRWRPVEWCSRDLRIGPGHGAAIARLSE